jgi:radical SAM superfamily enzyme
MNKPQNEDILHTALFALNQAGINVIGNIIIGLPGETIKTYKRTIKMLGMYNFYSLNINNLALYNDTALSNEIESDGTGDNEESSKHKSYHTETDRKAIDYFHGRIYELGMEIIEGK